MVDQHYLFNSVTSIIFVILIMGGFALYCNLLVKKYKRPLGELLTWQAITHNESIFVLMMIAACVAEGLSAATVLAPGLIPANPIARNTSHLFISFAGIVGALTLFKDTAQVAIPGSDPTSRFFQFIVVLFLLGLALGSPILNLILMAGNLKQEIELQLFFFGLNPFVTQLEWERTIAFYGHDPKWSAWAALEPNLKVSFGITVLHFLIAGLEGARSMSTAARRKQLFETYDVKKEGEKKEGEKKEENSEEKSEDDNSMKRNFTVMLSFFGYTGSELADLANKGYEVLYSMSDTGEQGKMGVRAAQLAQDTISLGKKNLNGAEKDRQEKELKLRIREFFGATKDKTKQPDIKKRGLGITLKSVK